LNTAYLCSGRLRPAEFARRVGEVDHVGVGDVAEITGITAIAGTVATAPSLAGLADKLNKLALVIFPELRGWQTGARSPSGSGDLTSGETSIFSNPADRREPKRSRAATGPDFA
jgi:hypothetical protein